MSDINKIASSLLQINRLINELGIQIKDVADTINMLGKTNAQKYSSLACELKTAYNVLEKSQDNLQNMFYETEEITDIEPYNWHELRPFVLCKGKTEKSFFPKAEGEYLVILEEEIEDEGIRYRRYYDIANWSKDLANTDEDIFKDKNAGWWKWDKSLKKIEIKNIIAWTALPHIRSNEALA